MSVLFVCFISHCFVFEDPALSERPRLSEAAEAVPDGDVSCSLFLWFQTIFLLC